MITSLCLECALEPSQAYGTRAKQAASELVFGREVTLQTYGKDKYGRTIADVLLPDGSNVNHDSWCGSRCNVQVKICLS
jgi:endonuclease YncB( thermonuclease family)